MDHILDAKNKKLGRLASEVALILQGKKKADYAPNKDNSDKVVIKNISQIEVSGKKASDKIYRHYTGYPGNLKEEKFEDIFTKNPPEVLKRAVWNMLPKNHLRSRRIKRLTFEK
ncbi:MAG: 50S ribosomal protein L13 [Candidatus Liptonbacteria bacterium RIFOXYC1_FULL_36_8]|uniref:Large ribosomal subunit protein uL13 n=3 Tax=Candidatus Liptoniibacteriota TaxID=1817909 RepID=A0A1G2CNH6_9BACT|nr:MAG: 50S ribosomal protein L13 [Candidatus Liptonbacteria bacterium RIFOXYB1_FULL_36_10]OGZ04052.1 MAG: 50S ribosomal protein L13 [Candidatus Liptonbacteria bacterium RIFOXYC1_FULL_36_8]OGZ04237.1 MAG: 50S ribosomal protein L13 [Candidatus Liptonbacteria bacterium RIFOXYD1_FULL_36_11]